MSHHASGPLAELLLTRRGLAYVASEGPPSATDRVRGVELELGHLGFVASDRLRRRLRRLPIEGLTAFRAWAIATLAAHSGADREHEPLFRDFPDGVPEDTTELWWRKVIVHFLQGPEQPCLFCARHGTTHVLRPCAHVVCDHCFDGSSYSACPVCERRVDRDSPFFQPSPERPLPEERVRFRLLDLGEHLQAGARDLFTSLCARTQALSEADREALLTVVGELPEQVLFAGLMLRDDPFGKHFDPRTVELKFQLDGASGTYLPLVFDLERWRLHWLDVYSQGQLSMNNVETSRYDIARLCPESIAYFASGARPSMFDLGLLHMAARCRRVVLRGERVRQLVREPGEDAAAFHHRLCGAPEIGPPGDSEGVDLGPAPVLALLYRGDLELPEASRVYALFREQLTPDLAASDLL